MYTINPRAGILLVRKHKNTKSKADIVTAEEEEDKRLITCEVTEGSRKGETIIVGKYSLFELLLQGEKYYLLDESDVLATTDYTEDKNV